MLEKNAEILDGDLEISWVIELPFGEILGGAVDI